MHKIYKPLTLNHSLLPPLPISPSLYIILQSTILNVRPQIILNSLNPILKINRLSRMQLTYLEHSWETSMDNRIKWLNLDSRLNKMGVTKVFHLHRVIRNKIIRITDPVLRLKLMPNKEMTRASIKIWIRETLSTTTNNCRTLTNLNKCCNKYLLNSKHMSKINRFHPRMTTY